MQLPPVVTYTAQSVTLGSFTFNVDYLAWVAQGGDLVPSISSALADTLAEGVASRIGTLRALFDPLTRFTGASATVTDVRLRYSFLPFLFNTDVRITADLVLNYEVGTVTAETKLVQPPTIVVDPPAFAFQAPGVSNLSGIAGRLTIRGGDAPEGLGDRVIVHNEALVGATTGKLETFTQPRYVQVGQDGAGNPLYAQDQDADSGDDLYESSLELRGIGLGITDASHLGLNGLTVFHGIELQGIESLDIRFGTGNDTFTVVDTGFTRANDGQQTTTLLPTKLTISGGAGGDTINVQQVGGETRISGGGGADIVNIHSPANELARILGLVTFDGDGTLTQTPIAFIDTDARLQLFLTTRNTIVGTGSTLTTGDGRSYRLALFEPILLDPNTGVSGTALQVRVVVLNTNGSIATEFVQEKGSLKLAQQKRNALNQRLWYDASGTETTVNTGIPVLIDAAAPTGFSAEQVYLDGSFTEVLVNTGNPQYETNFLSGSPLYVNSGGYRTTSVVTGRPSLIEINVTQLVPFQQVYDTRGSAASTGDVLNIVNTGDSSDITGVLDQIHVALEQLDTNGRIVVYGGSDPDNYYLPARRVLRTYMGGEAVINPFTGLAVKYVGGEAVLDLFTKAPILDPFGNPVLHHADDPVLHYRGDQVVHQLGEVQRYLGGEIALDESGAQVTNPDGTFLRRLPDQAIIYNRFEDVLAVSNAHFANLTNPALTVVGLSAAQNFKVTVIDTRQTLGRGWIFELAATEFTRTGDDLTILLAASGFLTVDVTMETPVPNQIGDPLLYFGNEAVAAGQPVVDSQGGLVVDNDGNVILYTASTIVDSRGRPILHRRGSAVLRFDTPSNMWVDATFTAADVLLHPIQRRLGKEPKLYLGGELAYYSAADPVAVDTTLYHVGLQGVAGGTTPRDFNYWNVEDVRLTTGEGADVITIASTHTQSTTVTTNNGNDRIAIRTISGNTTISSGAGDDVIAVGSTAGVWETTTAPGVPGTNPQFIAVNGRVDGIAAVLTIDGGAPSASDALLVDDTGDTNDNDGSLERLASVTRITGLDMAGYIEYAGIEHLEVTLGHANDRFTIESTHVGGTTKIEGRSGNDELNVKTISSTTSVAGDGFTPTVSYGNNSICTGVVGINVACGTTGGDDVINVGSQAGVGGSNFNGNLQGIGAALTVQGGGQGDIDRLNVDDSGDPADRAGTLTTTTITGLAMHASGITYTQIEALHVMLGKGNDAFHVAMTHFGTTRLSGGPGNDAITIESIQGATQVEGDDPVVPATETFSVAAKEFVRVQRILDSLVAITVTVNGIVRSDYTFAEGDKLVTFASPVTGTVVVAYNPVVNNRGGLVDYVRSPAIALGTTFEDMIKVNVDAAGVEKTADGFSALNGVGALLSIDGQRGSDHVTAFFAGATYAASYPALGHAHPISLVDVHDSGDPADGTNKLDVYLPNDELISDNLLLRRNFLALMPTDATAERINYDYTSNRGLGIFGRDGDDRFALDDNSVMTTIDGGRGDDRFQVGQMFQSTREFDKIPFKDDVFETVETTRGFLSNGITHDTTLFGGQGDDRFTVFHNTATLALNGESGNDTFIVRAFALKGSQAIDPNQKITSIFGGLGNDFVEYTDNAPVNIDGGAGTDTVVVIGTEFSDTFVINRDGVYGAGLFVRMLAIEILKVDGLEGNDRFIVLSTNPGVSTTIFGSRGSDSFEVGGSHDGSPITVDARDLLGHSGLVAHSITSSELAYAATVIQGISVDLADNDAPAVVVTPTGTMRVYEGVAGSVTTYTIVLTQAPVGGSVFLNVSPTELSETELAAGSQPLAFLVGGSVLPALVLTFTAANWFIPQTVTVFAPDDSAPQGNQKQVSTPFTAGAGQTTFNLGVTPLRLESVRINGTKIRTSQASVIGSNVQITAPIATGAIVEVTYLLQDGALTFQPLRHSISEASAANYHGVNIPGVVVEKVDNDAAGVIITPSGDDTVVFEGGATDTYTVGLSRAPGAGETVTVTLSLALADGDVIFSNSVLTFTAADWAARTVTLTARQDPTIDGFKTATIRHTVTSTLSPSGVTNFNGISVADLDVLVADDDIGLVLIRETGGATRVIEAGAAVPGAYAGATPFIDSYTVVLTKAPTTSVTVNIQPIVTATGGTLHDNFVEAGANTFSLTQTPRGGLVTRVLVNGIRIPQSQFSVTGGVLTITAPLPGGANIAVTYSVDNAAKQVVVSTTSGGTYTDGLSLLFTPGNWNVAQTVWVKAIDDAIIDGDGVQATAQQPRSLDTIQGPLAIFGGDDPDGDTTIPAPVLYIGEIDPSEFVADPNPNFDAVEAEQVDVLSALDTDSVADKLGLLADHSLTGLGMHNGRTIGGVLYPAGLRYSDIELLRVDLGKGNDRLRIASTHGTITIVNANTGNDQINIQTVGRPDADQRRGGRRPRGRRLELWRLLVRNDHPARNGASRRCARPDPRLPPHRRRNRGGHDQHRRLGRRHCGHRNPDRHELDRLEPRHLAGAGGHDLRRRRRNVPAPDRLALHRGAAVPRELCRGEGRDPGARAADHRRRRQPRRRHVHDRLPRTRDAGARVAHHVRRRADDLRRPDRARVRHRNAGHDRPRRLEPEPVANPRRPRAGRQLLLSQHRPGSGQLHVHGRHVRRRLPRRVDRRAATHPRHPRRRRRSRRGRQGRLRGQDRQQLRRHVSRPPPRNEWRSVRARRRAELVDRPGLRRRGRDDERRRRHVHAGRGWPCERGRRPAHLVARPQRDRRRDRRRAHHSDRQRRGCHLDDVRNRANAPRHGPRDPHADDRRPQPRQPAARRQPAREHQLLRPACHRLAEHRPRQRERRLQRPGRDGDHERLRAERRRPLLRLVAGQREPDLGRHDGLPRGEPR